MMKLVPLVIYFCSIPSVTPFITTLSLKNYLKPQNQPKIELKGINDGGSHFIGNLVSYMVKTNKHHDKPLDILDITTLPNPSVAKCFVNSVVTQITTNELTEFLSKPHDYLQYDLITVSDLYQLPYNTVQTVIVECAKLLKKEGIIAIKNFVPKIEKQSSIDLLLKELMKKEEPDSDAKYTHFVLEDDLLLAGFVQIDTQTWPVGKEAEQIFRYAWKSILDPQKNKIKTDMFNKLTKKEKFEKGIIIDIVGQLTYNILLYYICYIAYQIFLDISNLR